MTQGGSCNGRLASSTDSRTAVRKYCFGCGEALLLAKEGVMGFERTCTTARHFAPRAMSS